MDSSFLPILDCKMKCHLLRVSTLLVALAFVSVGEATANYVIPRAHGVSKRGPWNEGMEAVIAPRASSGRGWARFLMTWNSRKGDYLVNLNVSGRSFNMIADTGSDLTWVKADCKSLKATTRCESRLCKNYAALFSLSCPPSPTALCSYNFKYGGNESAQGIFANQSVFLPGGREMKAVLVGCTTSAHGSRLADAAGVIGLAFSHFSLQAFTPFHWPKILTYCLNSAPTGTSYLGFGQLPLPAKETRLLARSVATMAQLKTAPWLYAVQNAAFSLDYGNTKWSATAGKLAFDLGTTITSLKDDLYTKLVQSLTAGPLAKLQKVPKRSVFEYCYAKNNQMPHFTLTISFGKARFTPPMSSILVEEGGVLCLGIVNAGMSAEYSTLGNLMQRGYLWVFHISSNAIAIAGSKCSP